MLLPLYYKQPGQAVLQTADTERDRRGSNITCKYSVSESFDVACHISWIYPV